MFLKEKKIKCIVHKDKGIPGQENIKCTVNYLASHLDTQFIFRGLGKWLTS